MVQKKRFSTAENNVVEHIHMADSRSPDLLHLLKAGSLRLAAGCLIGRWRYAERRMALMPGL